MLELELLKNFRNIVNDNSYYVLHKYRNQEGKNRWNIICSAMDWLTVAANNYNNFSISLKGEDIDDYCMQVYNLISIIDIIYEAIKQLHRVLIDRNSIPYQGEKSFFKDTIKDDNQYFKHIRAIFGAHPVDINDDKGKWFASWPTKDHFGNYDIEVFLYPLDSEKDSITFGIYLKDLRRFASSRYNYLNLLTQEIKFDFEQYELKCRNTNIDYTGDYLKDACIAKAVMEERLPNDWVGNLLDDSISFLSTKNSLLVNKNKVDNFLEYVKIAVDDIKVSVQYLDYSEKISYKIFDYSFPKQHFYEFSKYSEVLLGKYDPLEQHFYEVVSQFLKPYVIITRDMPYDEIHLLFHVGLYNWKLLSCV